MRISTILIGAVLLCSAVGAHAQQPDTLLKKLDSLRGKGDTAKQVNQTDKSLYTEETKITLPAYFILLGSNMKQSFTKPFHMKKKDWFNMAGFIGLEAALSFADKPIQRNALDLRDKNKTVREVSDYITRFGGLYEVYTLMGLAATSYITKNRKLRSTTLLASQSYLTAGAVQLATKFLSGRQRPTYIDRGTLQPEPSFQGPFYKSEDANGYKTNSSFPSGHTTGAFAAATVFSMEYKGKKLVPYISYTIATLIGLSRITENKHWFTDILAGAALGYLTGQQVVNNYHRYARIKNGEANGLAPKKKNQLSFTIDYSSGVVQPGLVYRIN
ncbi:phosphatase PAP2 family protein [Sediminibacterium soli]|uniref:phosphatase PAP2 family protein n=1 Tax=Sediminibacterium soli TaxID=2698829 RepID=UPI00137ADB91|nr:phosphatase PAP2 family protein [Sediminibacterium soli]NCI45893.1 phosphatase PAP2 family protein [Sediminibacterium soli]